MCVCVCVCLQHCSAYDAQVSEWLWGQVGSGPAPAMTVPMTLSAGLRYGENPHQAAAFYMDDSLREAGQGGVASAMVHWGKEMSYNNYLVRDTHTLHTHTHTHTRRYSFACIKPPRFARHIACL